MWRSDHRRPLLQPFSLLRWNPVPVTHGPHSALASSRKAPFCALSRGSQSPGALYKEDHTCVLRCLSRLPARCLLGPPGCSVCGHLTPPSLVRTHTGRFTGRPAPCGLGAHFQCPRVSSTNESWMTEDMDTYTFRHLVNVFSFVCTRNGQVGASRSWLV